MADVERERIGAVVLLKNWLGDLAQDRGSVLEVSAYLSGALCDLAEGIARFNARRMALLCTEAEVAKRELSELRTSLRKALGAPLAEEVPEKIDSRNGSHPGSPRTKAGEHDDTQASGERSDTTSPGEGGSGFRKSPPLTEGAERWRRDGNPLTESGPGRSRAGSGDVKQGVFKGLHVNRVAKCRGCGTTLRVNKAVAQQWPEVDLCVGCHDLNVRVRSGPIASAPWEGVPDEAVVICDGCGLKSKAGLERRSWPLPTLCRECARAAEPEPQRVRDLNVTEEQHDAMLASMRARGELIEEQPMVAIHLEGVRAIGSYVHRKLTEAGTEAGTKGGETNPNSRKRPRGAKNAQNFREKREERFHTAS